MINRKIFFDRYRSELDPNRKLDQKEVSALDEFLEFVDGSLCLMEMNQWAYVFATTFHETNATFLPVREAYWLSEEWRKRNLRYYPYYGRGYVQITWKRNYEVYSQKLGQDLVHFPDLAMVPKYAFKILVDGCLTGAFTGKKIGDYVNKGKTDYEGARRVINGTDKAKLIANYARTFENILRSSIIR